MPATPPIAAPVTPSLGPTPDTPRENTQSADRQIFDHAIELQEAALNDGGRLANPAALVGEAVEGFRKFFEKSRRVSRLPNELQSKSHDGPVITGASTTTSEVHSTLHRGPAQESLEPTGTNPGDFSRHLIGAGNSQVEDSIVMVVEMAELNSSLAGPGSATSLKRFSVGGAADRPLADLDKAQRN